MSGPSPFQGTAPPYEPSDTPAESPQFLYDPPALQTDPPTYLEPAPPRTTPNFTDLGILILILIAGFAILILGASVVAAIWKATHPSISLTPSRSRALAFGIPLQMLWYVIIAAIAVPIFRHVWQRPFREGIHWNGHQVAAHAFRYILLGVGLSLVVSIISTRLHAPKDAPIVELFQSRTLAWITTFFGAFIAPTAEELGFRGFLLPAIQNRTGAVFATIVTSVLFAWLHAGQLGHAWGPVAILFFVSVFLCIVRLRTDSVAAAALLHSSYNATIFIAMIVATGGYRHLDKLSP
jgi:membrane protease YdiL (CAAX protease family)